MSEVAGFHEIKKGLKLGKEKWHSEKTLRIWMYSFGSDTLAIGH